MEHHGYALNPYPVEPSHDVYHAAPVSSFSSPQSHHNPRFSAVSKQFYHSQRPVSRDYEPLNEAYLSPGPSYLPTRANAGALAHWAWWLPEILASILACACLCTIVAVLHYYNGRSLASIVLPASLTLNGIVAAISTLARVALMVPVGSILSQEAWLWFSRNTSRQHKSRSRLKDLDLVDAASRGAWGSLVFLVRGRGRLSTYLATLLTIVSLVFGTATQQLLAVDQFPVKEAALMPGNLPRAETWQFYDTAPAEQTPSPPFSVRAAMYNGFLRDTVDPITVSCATGNCTWPITPSLAVCGECSPSPYTYGCNETACIYNMPSGTNISLMRDVETEGIGFQVTAGYKGAIYDRSLGDRAYLINFDMVGSGYISLVQGFKNANVNASECALWMCVQSYDTRMVAGTLHENVTMSFSDLAQPIELNMSPFDNYTFADLPAAMNPTADVAYNVSDIGLVSLGGNLPLMFTGYGFLDIESSRASSDTVDAIWHASSDPDPWVKTLATSITRAIRYDDINPIPPSRRDLVPAPNRTSYDGTAYELGVRVQWPWLVLPIVCVMATILLLVAVIIETARSSVVPWKASLITLLFFEADPSLKSRAAAGMSNWSGVYKAVGDSEVVLREDRNGRWTMKEIDKTI